MENTLSTKIITDGQKIRAFNTRFWTQLNPLCLKCIRSCKQSALTVLVRCAFEPTDPR